MRAPRKLLFVLVGLLLLDVFVSGTLVDRDLFLDRPLPPFGARTHPRQDEWLANLERPPEERDGLGRFDAELGWTWRPSAASPDGRFHINADGQRGTRSYAARPGEDVLRIACFGDSFVFGDEIPDRSTFPAILEARKPKWEVPNYGVSGYGTDQALLRFRRRAARPEGLGARIVVLGFLFENVGRNVNRYRPLWNPSTGFCATKPRFVLEGGPSAAVAASAHGSGAGDTLRLLPQPYPDERSLALAVRDGSVVDAIRDHEFWIDRPSVPRWSSLMRLVGWARAQRARQVSRLYADPEREPVRVTLALLETFHREALASGAERALILLLPSERDLAHADGGTPFWSTLVDALEARGVPCLDTSPALLRRRAELQAEGREHALYFGYHLSGEGNAVVAAELERWVDRGP